MKGINKWKQSPVLGLGDFFVYNILVLITIPQSPSMIIKVCVAFGTMVSVQIGHLLTYRLISLVKVATAPGVPLPIITVSIYIFVLDIILPKYFNQCIEF